MRANLVFSPFIIPRAPLGIALLKSYVENNSDFLVKCLDVNIMCHNAMADAIRNDKGNVETSGHNQINLPEAVDVFKNNNGQFFDQAAYERATAFFVAYFTKLKGVLNEGYGTALQQNNLSSWFVQECVDLLLSNRPDVVGFSIMFEAQFYFSALVARVLKTVNNNIKIVFGGRLASEAYEEVLTHPYIDFIVLNEGEKAFLDLLRALNGEKELDEVPNLAYRKNGKVTVTEPSAITNLDEIPFPDFSDFDLDAYLSPAPVVSVLGSRGCYWRRCAFCVHHKGYFNKYRTASIKRVVDELEYHVNNGIKYFDFVDEMVSAARFKQIGEEIIRRKLQISYYALAKPTADFTKDVFEVMYKSGCRYLIWGVESGCQRILDLIDKGTNAKDMPKVLADSASAGIKNHVFIIIGFPSETKEELKETLHFLYESKDNIHAIHKGTFLLFKGSLIHKNPQKFYITQIHESDSSRKALGYDVSQGLKHNELEHYRKFYNNNYFCYFNYFSGAATVLRNHALLHYSNPDKLVFNLKRKAVPCPAEVGAPGQPVSVAI